MTTSDLDLARDLAVRAGRLLLELRESFGPIDPRDKERSKELRDTADRTSNDLIMRGLIAARPGDAILSEEGKDDDRRLTADRVWIVDPLDGTWEYGQGRADFGVHIALWNQAERRVETGVVDLPDQGLTRTSGDHGTLPPLATDRPLRVVVSRTRPPAELDRIVTRWSERAGREVEIVNVGSVGAKVNEILCGRAEAYLHDTGFYEWDVAAPLAVGRRYGLEITHWDRTGVGFNQMPPYVRDLFVAHPEVASDLRASLPEG
ncbi:MAG: inositol monophosphatase family protein [Candidatus Nanopelagicales bacterium]|nr:inositol monophosphatase family protein [Candidatus Nanopelagicales bacterium]